MRVTPESLGAWVIKCNPAVTPVEEMVETGRPVTSWCVAANYRSALMAAGQPALLWVSGAARGRYPRGIWGVGRVTGPALAKRAPAGAGLVAPLHISLLDSPVPAQVLAAIPALGDLEVLRQPYMSNPSWCTKAEFRAVRFLLAGTTSGSAPG